MLQDASHVIRWTDFISPGIATLALVLSLYTLYLQRRDRKPRLIIEPRLGMRPVKVKMDKYGGHRMVDDYCMVITLRNPTDKDITVTEVRFVKPLSSTILEAWGKLPIVESHKAAEIVIPTKNLLRAFESSTKAKGHIEIRDMLSNLHTSDKKEYNLRDLESYFPTYCAYVEHVRKQSTEPETLENGTAMTSTEQRQRQVVQHVLSTSPSLRLINDEAFSDELPDNRLFRIECTKCPPTSFGRNINIILEQSKDAEWMELAQQRIEQHDKRFHGE